MGKPGKWIRNLLTGKKDKDKDKEKEKTPSSDTPISTPPPTTPKEKRRWSFRRSSAATPNKDHPHADDDQKKHALALAPAPAPAQAALAVIRLTGVPHLRSNRQEEEEEEDACAVKIQSFFRGYLARKALSALKGLVKLQALVRGHLVRKQATATLRCMQALVTAQNRARAHRIRISDDSTNLRRSTHDGRIRQTYHHEDMDRGILEENIKIVEMDLGESRTTTTTTTRNRNSCSIPNHPQTDHHRFSTHSVPNRPYSRQQDHRDVSPAPSALTDVSPRAYSGHFEDYSALSSPQCYSAVVSNQLYAESLPYDYEYPFFPNYMANTESSRAKARSQSAPKSRPPDAFERQPSTSRRRPSIEGRNVPRAVRMQRSSSHVGATAQSYQYPWSIKLDRSTVSLKDSECGSTSTVMTNPHYARSLVGFDPVKMR